MLCITLEEKKSGGGTMHQSESPHEIISWVTKALGQMDYKDLYEKTLQAWQSRESAIEDLVRQRDDFVAELISLKKELRNRDEKLVELFHQLSTLNEEVEE